MKKITFSLLIILVWACSKSPSVSVETLFKDLSSKRVMLPNGWGLTPAGQSVQLSDLPLNLVVSPNKKLIAVTNNGQSTQFITLIDAQSGIVLDNVEIKNSWNGLAFGYDNQTLFASTGNDNQVFEYEINDNKLKLKSTFVLGKVWPEKVGPSGLCVSKTQLFVVTKEDNSLYIFDLKSKKLINKFPLGAEAFTCQLSPDMQMLYISIWGAQKMLGFNLQTQKIEFEVPTQSHPNDFVISKNGKTIYVANANENSVSVIDITSRQVIETIGTALFAESPAGSTPNGVALSENEQTLYVANADNNCLAVFDVTNVGQSKSKGFIPTGWYPTSVKCIGQKIYVSNGKGFTSLANPEGPNPIAKLHSLEKGANAEAHHNEKQYIGGLLKGTMSIIPMPDEVTLGVYSKLVYQNCPYSKSKELFADGEVGNPIPMKVGEKSPIKYVFYIIKENRTYDQVFGDIKEGNGDANLCIFPEKITPNQHALAKEFVLLDNFYVDAEVSADGHNWSNAAYATDFVEKTWPSSYGGRGGTYDFEGSRAIAYPKLGYIWDYCKRAKVDFRTYGEFVYMGKSPHKTLENNYCKEYKSWDLKYKDVDRCKAWIKEFDELVEKNQVPRFNSLRMGNDHTSGAKAGAYTPYAMVADNDYAVGMFIDHLSHSEIWKESAVFILEDDAQNGSDHVDAHRSNVLVISPYVKRKNVEHSMYSTSGVLRTIELILGLPPMSQYDAAASSLWKCFGAKPDYTSYHVIAPNVNTDEKNTAYNTPNAKKSALFDFSKEDAAPDLALNQVIWESIKHSKMPAPKHAAFVKLPRKAEDDDDED